MGDVLLVALPSKVPSGHEQEGRRPVVVVGLPDVLRSLRFSMLVVVPLTTQSGSWVHSAPLVYPVLTKGAGGLPFDSIVLLDQLAGIDAARVLRKLGSLTEAELEPIRSGLKLIFGF